MLTEIRDAYDAIFLSPHLDDVALSCGGQVHRFATSGKSVLIVTIMAGDPASGLTSDYAHSLHERWRLEQDAVAARRAEDVAACGVLGADWRHWDFKDCIYRVDPVNNRPLYSSDDEIFGKIDTAETYLIGALANRMARLPNFSQIFVPLTLGHHVDHQLTRQAAERAFASKLIYYYEDYPYAREVSAEQFIARQKDGWQSRLVPLTSEAIQARIDSIKCFESQLSSFFADENDLEKQIRSFIQSVGGERIWHPYRINGGLLD